MKNLRKRRRRVIRILKFLRLIILILLVVEVISFTKNIISKNRQQQIFQNSLITEQKISKEEFESIIKELEKQGVKIPEEIQSSLEAERLEKERIIAEQKAKEEAEKKAAEEEAIRIAKEQEEKAQVTSRSSTNRATSGTVAEYQNYAYNLCINTYGWTEYDFECLVVLRNKESNWNANAHNNSSGAHGIPQSLPASKMASEGDDYYTNGYTQIRWGLKYIKSRYGSPSNAWSFWQQHYWY